MILRIEDILLTQTSRYYFYFVRLDLPVTLGNYYNIYSASNP
jgi:hypothetical protein